MDSNSRKIYVLADETGNVGDKSPWQGEEYHIHGAIVGSREAISKAARAGDEFRKQFAGAPAHISAISDRIERLDALNWVADFFIRSDLKFRAAVIERSYWPVVTLTDIMFAPLGLQGVAIKKTPGPYRQLIELCADRLLPEELVRDFWGIWRSRNWKDLDAFFARLSEGNAHYPAGLHMAQLARIGSQFLVGTELTMHELNRMRVVDHVRRTIQARAFEILIEQVLGDDEGGGISIEQDRSDFLRKWHSKRFHDTGFQDAGVEISFGTDARDKERFFLVDALCWLAGKCFGTKLEGSADPSHRTFASLLASAPDRVTYNGITRSIAVKRLEGLSLPLNEGNVFACLLLEYDGAIKGLAS